MKNACRKFVYVLQKIMWIDSQPEAIRDAHLLKHHIYFTLTSHTSLRTSACTSSYITVDVNVCNVHMGDEMVRGPEY
jgi:hypothetical protein